MPNYNLVIDSTFQPFSFEEMLQPVMIAQAAHREIEDAYSDLSTKAGEFEILAESERLRNGDNSETYKRYSSYARDLRAQVDSLMREGLTSSSRNRMMELKRRYYTDIDPIKKASERLKDLSDERRKQEISNPTLRYERGYNEIGIDELLLNPDLTYGKSYSGALIEQQAASAASALAKNMREDPNGWQKILGNQYYQRKIQKGYTPEEVLLASLGDYNAPKELQDIMTKAIATSGIESWEGYFDNDGNITQRGQSILSDVRSFAGRGLNTAVGGTEYERVSNKAYDYAMQDQRARAAKEAENKSRLYYRAVPKTTVDGDKNTRQMNEDLKLIQEIMSNPALLNKKDTRTVRNPKYISPDPMMSFIMDSGLGESRQETYYPYQEKLKELSKRYGNVNYTITDGKLSGGNLAELAQQLDRDIRSSAVRAFSYKPNITQSDLITQVLKENTRSYYRRSNSTGLWELDDNKKGDEVDIEDLNNYFTSDADIDFDPDLGFIINSTDSKGTTRLAILDTELLDDQNRTFSRAQQAIRVALENGEDELATTLIEATMEAFYKRYNTLEKRQSNTFSKEE